MHDWKRVLERASKGNPPPPRRDGRTAAEWQQVLAPDVFRITRLAATERPFSSEMCGLFEPGIYRCACCGTDLFDARSKFESGTGWPSFSAPLADDLVAYLADHSHGMVRVETRCNVCDAHLGHVFPDGPAPTGLRFCINALALEKKASGPA
jgi:peptide-methionine (R)-S-oxide reductase